jgi:5-methyltetrahydrofolate--homocysteine methyltransferase
MQAVRGADVVMGHDPECMAWIQAYRKPASDGGRRRRSTRRRGAAKG